MSRIQLWPFEASPKEIIFSVVQLIAVACQSSVALPCDVEELRVFIASRISSKWQLTSVYKRKRYYNFGIRLCSCCSKVLREFRHAQAVKFHRRFSGNDPENITLHSSYPERRLVALIGLVFHFINLL